MDVGTIQVAAGTFDQAVDCAQTVVAPNPIYYSDFLPPPLQVTTTSPFHSDFHYLHITLT